MRNPPPHSADCMLGFTVVTDDEGVVVDFTVVSGGDAVVAGRAVVLETPAVFFGTIVPGERFVGLIAIR